MRDWLVEQIAEERRALAKVEGCIAALEACLAKYDEEEQAIEDYLDERFAEQCSAHFNSPEMDEAPAQPAGGDKVGAEQLADEHEGSGESDEQDAVYYP